MITRPRATSTRPAPPRQHGRCSRAATRWQRGALRATASATRPCGSTATTSRPRSRSAPPSAPTWRPTARRHLPRLLVRRASVRTTQRSDGAGHPGPPLCGTRARDVRAAMLVPRVPRDAADSFQVEARGTSRTSAKAWRTCGGRRRIHRRRGDRARSPTRRSNCASAPPSMRPPTPRAACAGQRSRTCSARPPAPTSGSSAAASGSRLRRAAVYAWLGKAITVVTDGRFARRLPRAPSLDARRSAPAAPGHRRGAASRSAEALGQGAVVPRGLAPTTRRGPRTRTSRERAL